MKSPLCVFLLYSIIFPSIGAELGLKTLNPKLTHLNLQIRCLFYHLTLKEESAPIMKPSGHTSSLLSTWNSWNDKNDLVINALISPIWEHSFIGNKCTYFLALAISIVGVGPMSHCICYMLLMYCFFIFNSLFFFMFLFVLNKYWSLGSTCMVIVFFRRAINLC